ncbi:MAG TPA: glycoside hydrolase family 30 beta sandwich domain-containing protein [Bryobacteraceae bacterium]|jgi:glucosylceramidase|nr:glycoside hydrolase family 30 beta sandwich domain-containing protein [Bryobacteraceae bacterium]
MDSYTRRNLLKLSSLGLVPLALDGAGSAQSGDASPQAGIRVHTTAGAQRFGEAPALAWRPESGSLADCITVQPGTTFQNLLGFGAAFTDAACYVVNQLSTESRNELFHELFHPSKMGLNVCRLCMGASDYSTKVYSYDEGGPDPELDRFSIDHDREYIIPVLQSARAVNPNLFLFASPWSPPAWMKVNNSMLGGLMEKKHFAAYAKYFVRFLQAYAEAGIEVNAVTIQNEVDTEQDGRMPASLWGQEYEAGFVAEHLGRALADAQLKTKIWIIDHNYNLWGRAIAELDDPEVNRYVDGVAWHGYLGQPSAMTRVHDAHPEKHMYWTEGGPSIKSPAYATDWAEWGTTFAGILRNWSRCIVSWNLALDENGSPNIGPFDCGGVVTVHSKTKQIAQSGQYWAFAHYSRAARPGAMRMASSGHVEEVSHVAFANPDGTKALVVTNRGQEKQILVRMSGHETAVTLPHDSLSTLTWS